jgi:hypothetical protein
MVQIMRDTRLRAPHKPLGCDNIMTLYRGMNIEGLKRFLADKKGFLDDKSFASFSHDFNAAARFAGSKNTSSASPKLPVILQLELSDVPAGTPWLWFGGTCGRNWTPRNKNRTMPGNANLGQLEKEVVLPPGRYVIYKRSKTRTYISNEPVWVWHVTFKPDTTATSTASISGHPAAQAHRPRIYPRAYRPSVKNDGVEGYVPLYTLFNSGTNQKKRKIPPKSPSRPATRKKR